jgi:nicotinate dehydrogenase subunit B
VSEAGAAGPATAVVNGREEDVTGAEERRLLDWLRNDLRLTGAKPACGEGQCGACTVLVDGEPVFSCRTAVGEVAGRTVTTVEGLASSGALHPVQRALLAEGAVQCGYCMPGMVLRAAAFLDHATDPEVDDVAGALDPNLCRCGGYRRIVRAVRLAATAGSGHRRPPEEPEPPARDLAAPPARSVGALRLPAGAIPWDLCPAEDRDYAGVLGPGLVSVAPPAASPGAWASSGGAWLHVGADGVTAFSGKVDVGQDNRTALRALVAEELCVEPVDVTLVQGDTDVCPFDVGTFGSQSMPVAGEALRRAAAGARRVLIELAAARWEVPPEGLDARDGAVVGTAGAARLPYADLVRGLRRVDVVAGEPPLRAAADRRLVGRRWHDPTRADAVTGGRLFVSDLAAADMGYGAVLRPPVRGSGLLSLDAAAARSMDGVVVVEDERVVGVVADTPGRSRAALDALSPVWAEPPAPEGADDIAAYLRGHPAEGSGWEAASDRVAGDLESGLARAVVRSAATYSTAYIAHVPMETRAALAAWDSGRLTLWTSTQVPFGVRRKTAEALGLDESAVRVVVPPTGGGFGGKHGAEVAIEAAVLARGAGRPVMVHWSRKEEFHWGTLRPMALVDVSAGLDADGELCAWDFRVVNAGPAAIDLPYRVAAVRLRNEPAASPVRQGSYRALGATANNFARESAIDELARSSGADPVAFRIGRLEDERLIAVLRVAAERFGWRDRPVRGGLGHGVAVGLEKDGRVATFAEVEVDEQRRVRVRRVVTAYECGSIVNADTVAGQVEGAMVMGLGGALFEAVELAAGRVVTEALAGYRVPRAGDVPDIDVVLVDRPDLPASGAGETPMIALAPAIANALFDATGVRVRHLPLAPGGRLA